MAEKIDLGNGYSASWARWSPDRKLNPQYAHIPDIEHCSLLITCPHGNSGGITIDSPEAREVFKEHTEFWTLLSVNPIHVEPSIQFMEYVDGNRVPGCCHGWIRDGKWVNA